MTGTDRPDKRRSGMRSSRTYTRTAARTKQRLASRSGSSWCWVRTSCSA